MPKSRSGYLSLYRLIFKEYFFSFVVAFAFFFFIFFVNQMLLLAEDILSKNAPINDVLLLVFFALPSIVAISVPFAALVGSLMTVGELSSENELTAIQAGGIPLSRVFIPMSVLAVIFSISSFFMNDYFLPMGTLNFGKVYRRLIYSTPELELESYSVKSFQDTILITGEIKDNIIHHLTIMDRQEDEYRIISAQTALLRQEKDLGIIALHLNDCFINAFSIQKKGEYSFSSADSMRYNILLKDITISIRNPGPREMTSFDVLQVIKERTINLDNRKTTSMQSLRILENNFLQMIEQMNNNADFYGRFLQEDIAELNNLQNQIDIEKGKVFFDRTLQIFELEFHKKFSIPFSCISFLVFAFPAGLFSKRSGRAVGFGIGIFVSIIYWGMLIGGQTIGLRTHFSPVLAMWLPNVIVLLTGCILIIMRFRR